MFKLKCKREILKQVANIDKLLLDVEQQKVAVEEPMMFATMVIPKMKPMAMKTM